MTEIMQTDNMMSALSADEDITARLTANFHACAFAISREPMTDVSFLM